MEKSTILFVVLAFSMSSTWSLAPSQSKQFRPDYKYSRQTDAFYKLYTPSNYRKQPGEVCSMEGATLLEPSQPEDMEEICALSMEDYGLFVRLWASREEHDLMEQHYPFRTRMLDVFDDRHRGEFRSSFYQAPFICKVQAKDAPHDPECDVFSNEYRYNSTVGSCYHIPPVPLTWNEADAECRAQNAHLVILNSETERDVVHDLIMSAPKPTGKPWYFAGFKAEKPVGNERVVYRTILNQTLEEAGFATWTVNEPNNWHGIEYCGSLHEGDGNLNDYVCSISLSFICEKEISSS